MVRVGRFFVPGVFIAGKFRRSGILILELLALAAVSATMYLARKTSTGSDAKAAPVSLVPDWLVFSVIGFAALALYIGKSQTEQDRVDKEAAQKLATSAEDAALEMLKQYKGQIAGPMAFLACAIIDKKPTDAVRMAILSHAVDVARKYLRIEASDSRLTATWAVARDDYSQWEVVAYDRYHADRQPGTIRPIAADAPGAPRVFLTGEHDFVVDIHATENKQHFRAGAKYRSILSVPARILNVKGVPTRDIDGRQSAILGVLSIDSTDADLLKEDLRFVMTDAAFLLAIVELLGEKHASAA